MCALEIVAWLAGERHSDSPGCTSPVIAAFVRSFNDVIPTDAGRDYYLRRWIPRLINTAAPRHIERKRATAVVDYMVRGLLPMLLHKQGRTTDSRELAGLKQITSRTGVILSGLAVRQECGNRMVSWAIKMAARDAVPSLWVPTASRLIGEIGTPAAFEAGVDLISRLISSGVTPKVPRPDRKTAPPSV
jgi:hypothetical protein